MEFRLFHQVAIYYDSNGKPTDNIDSYIVLLPVDTSGYYKGWYFIDAAGEPNGPFNTYEDAVSAESK